MAKKISRKELLKGPDEFMTLSERAAAFVQGHMKQISAVGIALGVACIVYLGTTWYLGYSERRGQEAYNKAYYTLRNAEAAGEGIQDPTLPMSLFQQVTEEHGLAKVSDLALTQLAYLKFQEGRHDEAISLYRAFQSEVPDRSKYQDMARLALGACYEAKKEYGSAVEELQPLAENKESPLRQQAMLSLIRIYKLEQNTEKADEILSTFGEDYPDSPFLAFAQSLVQ